MSEELLRVFTISAPDAEDRVLRIKEAMRSYGIDEIEVQPTTGATPLAQHVPMFEETDAILIFVSNELHAERDLKLLMGEYPLDFGPVADRGPSKILLVLLDDGNISDVLVNMPAFEFFDGDDSEFTVGIERLSYYVRDHVHAHRAAKTKAEKELEPEPEPEGKFIDEPGAGDDSEATTETPEETPEEAPASKPKPRTSPMWIAAAVAIVFAIWLGNYLDRQVPEIVDGILYEDAYAVEFLLVRPQGFLMGSPSLDSFVDERPQHAVNLQPFLIGLHEVTNKLYDEYRQMKDVQVAPAISFADEPRGAWPVVNVSFDNAQAFARWFGTQTGASYRLPTESEWEYLARQAESVLQGPCGVVNFRGGSFDTSLSPASNMLRGPIVDTRTTCYEESPVLVEVDTLSADPIGLFHLYGNAAEWVQDCYAANYLAADDDGSASESGDCEYRVFRGGSWLSPLDLLSPTLRSRAPPDYSDFHIGFRLVRQLDRLDLFAIGRPGTNWNQILLYARWSVYGAAALLVFSLVWWERSARRRREVKADDAGEAQDSEPQEDDSAEPVSQVHQEKNAVPPDLESRLENANQYEEQKHPQ